MYKRIFLALTLSVAAVAAADHILLQGSSGRGAATNGNREGLFQYAVGSRSSGGHVQMHGSLTYAEHQAGISIRMGVPDRLQVQGPTAAFSGLGSFTRRTAQGDHTIHGRVVVVVNDNRNPRHTPENPFDTFTIEFRDSHNNVVYSFGGDVTHGDLEVFQRREP